MQDDQINDFFLVGGTALALQIGHRISIDIDLFSEKAFDESAALNHLIDRYKFQLAYKHKNTLKGAINGVQVDLITHTYPLVQPIKTEEGVRLASLEDIAAMKLNAIVGNGTRVKDFLDVAYLSCYLSLEQMMQACERKYANINPLMIIRSLCHTDDVIKDEPIKLTHGRYSFDSIKKRLDELQNHPGKVFTNLPQ